MLHCTPVFFFWRGRGIQQKYKSSTIVLRKIKITSQVIDTQSWVRSFLSSPSIPAVRSSSTSLKK
nr:MAG TPA: hypothetical protein [Caudoviricetes sp.]